MNMNVKLRMLKDDEKNMSKKCEFKWLNQPETVTFLFKIEAST